MNNSLILLFVLAVVQGFSEVLPISSSAHLAIASHLLAYNGLTLALAAGMRVVGVLTHAAALDGIRFSVATFMDVRLDSWLSAQSPE